MRRILSPAKETKSGTMISQTGARVKRPRLPARFFLTPAGIAVHSPRMPGVPSDTATMTAPVFLPAAPLLMPRVQRTPRLCAAPLVGGQPENLPRPASFAVRSFTSLAGFSPFSPGTPPLAKHRRRRIIPAGTGRDSAKTPSASAQRFSSTEFWRRLRAAKTLNPLEGVYS